MLVVVTATTYGVSASRQKRYESSAAIAVNPQAITTSLSGTQIATRDQFNLAPAIRLIQTTSLATSASTKAAGPSASDILGTLRVTGDDSSGVITVTSSDNSPEQAARKANAIAQAAIDQQTESQRTTIDSAIAELLNQRRETDADARSALDLQLSQLRLLRKSPAGLAKVIQAAQPANRPSSPKTLRNTAIAAFVALVLALGVILLAEQLDRRINTVDQLEGLSNLPLLAAVPPKAFNSKVIAAMSGDERGGDPQVAGVFRQLRAALSFFEVSGPVRSVMVVSAGKGEGKTTTVTNLALAVASVGRSVVMVDGDLHRGTAAKRLGVDETHGLTDVLSGRFELEEVGIRMQVGLGSLRVIPPGQTPPNPAELLASERMRTLLATLHEEYEFVIVDSAPLIGVSDSVPLIEQVDGILAVVRVKASTRDAYKRLVTVTASARGHLLGVVATDAPAFGEAYGYGYGYGYGLEGATDREVIPK